jgi:hypothetical protein
MLKFSHHSSDGADFLLFGLNVQKTYIYQHFGDVISLTKLFLVFFKVFKSFDAQTSKLGEVRWGEVSWGEVRLGKMV